MDIGKRIKDLRQSAGLTQLGLVEIYNRSEPKDLQLRACMLSKYERNLNRCYAGTYQKLLDVIAAAKKQ